MIEKAGKGEYLLIENSAKARDKTLSDTPVTIQIQALLLLLLLSLLTTALSFPLQKQIDQVMEQLQAQTIESLEKRLGYTISYRRIRPSFLLRLELSDLTLKGEDDHKLLSLQRVEVAYNMFQLIKGDIGGAISKVFIINSHISIDTENDAALIQRLLPKKEPPGERIGYPEITLPAMPGFTITGKNISISITDKERHLSATRIYFTLEGREEVRFQVQTDIEITLDGAPISASLSSSGGWQSEESGTFDIRIKEFSAPWITLPRVALTALIERDTIHLRKSADRHPFDLEGTIDLKENAATLSLLMDSFQPSSFLNIPDPSREEYLVLLDNSYSGSFSLSLDALDTLTALNPPSFTISELLAGEQLEGLSYKGEIQAEIEHFPEIGLPFEIDHHLSIRLEGTHENLNIPSLRLSSSDMDIETSLGLSFFPFTFQSDMKVHRYQLQQHTLQGNLQGEYRDQSLRLRSSGASWGEIAVSKVDLLIDISGDDSYAFSLNLFFPGSEATSDTDSTEHALYADGEMGGGENFFIESTVLLDKLPLKPFLTEASAPEIMLQELFVDASFFFSSDGKRLSYSAGYLVISDESEESYLKLSGSGNLANHNFRDIEAQYGPYFGEGMASLSIREHHIALKTDIRVNDIEYGFSAYYDKESHILLTGEYDSKALLELSDGMVSFDASATRFPIPVQSRQEPSQISFKLHGNFASLQEWKLLIQSLQIYDFPLPLYQDLGSLEMKALLEPDRLSISLLRFTDSISTLEGKGDISYTLKEPLEARGWLKLSKPDGAESYYASFHVKDHDLTSKIDLNQARLKRAGVEQLTGKLNGECFINGPLEDPDISVEMDLRDALYGEAPLELESQLIKRGKSFTLDYGRFRYSDHLLQKLQGYYSLQEGSFQLSGEYQPGFKDLLVSAGFSITGTTEKIALIKQLPTLLESDLDAELILDPIITPEDVIAPQTFQFSRQKEELSLRGGVGETVDARFSPDGSFRLILTAPSPFVGTVEGRVKKETINATATIGSLDLSPLSGIADVGFFALQGGIASGEITIDGDLRDPSFHGSLSVRQTEATSILFENGLAPFDAYIKIRERSASLITESIQTGGSSLDVTGDFQFERWLPESFSIKILPDRDNGVPITYSIPNGGGDVSGIARGLFIVNGTEDTIELYGDLLVSNASVTLQNQDIGDDGTADSAAKNQVPFDILVDISIETGRRVEFFWPTTNFPILRSFAAPEQHLTIAVDSSKGEFSLLGDITIQGGEVSYLQRNFLLTRGEISFNENENRFDPRLTFEAILRDMSSEGEPIKIFLNVNNQPLSRFEPRFTSEPSMSDAEIIAVLGASLPSRIGQEALDITAGLALTGSMVSQLGILNSFESRVKEVLNLDLFSIRTYMIQNLILDRVGSVITNEAVQGSAFSRYLDNTSIFLGKYFGNDLFIQGTLQIQANDAFTDESIYEDELFIDSEISIEWETPLFLLDFAIRPDFINPLETVNNASLGLRWGFSY